MKSPPAIPDSEHLAYRPYQPGDAALIEGWLNDPRVHRFFEHEPAFCRDRLTAVIERLTRSEEDIGIITSDRGTGLPLGIFEIRDLSRQHQRCAFEIAIGEVDRHGKGFGLEMIRAMTDYVRTNLGVSRITMKVFAVNVALLSTARRAGFRVEGILPKSVRVEGEWVDEVLLGLNGDRGTDTGFTLSACPVGRSSADLVGNTPFLALSDYFATDREVFAKLEAYNPGHNVKDRAAKAMLLRARAEGRLAAGTVILEVTSGNTSCGLAMVAAEMGYRSVAVAPEGVLKDGKMRHLQALGVVLVVTPGIGNYDRASHFATALAEALGDVYMPQQFENPANPRAHVDSTGREVTVHVGKVDTLIAGMGSGGTLMGLGEALRQGCPDLRVVAVEPKNASALLGQGSGDHRILGIGPGWVPPIVERGRIDHVITVTDADAVDEALLFARRLGLFPGISSGAALHGVRRALENGLVRRTALVVLPDSGLRYGGPTCYFSSRLRDWHEAAGAMIAVADTESAYPIARRVRAAFDALS